MSFHFRRTCSLGAMALLMALCLSGENARAADEREAGEYFLQQYAPKIYASHPQNWDIVQDARGVIFFANTGGVLEYDGAQWRKISLNGFPAFSLALGQDGVIYVGSQGQFGFLKPDANGELSFVSLLELVPGEARGFGAVWSTHVNSDGVWFRTANALFLLTPAKRLRVLRGHHFTRGFVVHDVYHALTDTGLYEVRNFEMQKVAASDTAPGRSLRSYFLYNGGTLAVTREGFFWRNQRGFTPWKTNADGYLHSAEVTTCVPLGNGQLAIATFRGGLVILNANGTVARIIDQDQELRSPVIHTLYQDHGKGLWMALDRGLARIEVEAPITAFGAREGVQETIWSMNRLNGRLFAGTLIGLSYLTLASDGSTPRFQTVGGINDAVMALLPHNDQLIVGAKHGIYSVSRHLQVKLIQPTEAIIDLAPSPSNPDLVFAAGRGIFVFEHKKFGWRLLRKIEVPNGEIRTVVEDRDGWLWATTQSAALHINWRVEPALIRAYDITPDLHSGFVNAYRLSSGIVLATGKGLRRFDVRQQRFVPDERFGKVFADGSRKVAIIREDGHGDVWITGEAYHGLLRRNGRGEYDWEESPLARTGFQELYSLFLDADNVVWASGADGGLIRYRDTGPFTRRPDSILLRRTEALESKKITYAGDADPPKSTSFPYREHALRFEFAFPSYEDETHNVYQVRLDGLDKAWSAWSTEPEKEYTNLPEGNYLLRIRARDIYGRLSREAQFNFSVRPPWYRTWWAFVLYAALGAGALVLFVKWRLAHMAADVRKFERLVADRTLEVRQQRDEIQAHERQTEALLLNILPAPIAEELRETGSVKPQAYGDVAVCFTDFVGFTLASQQMSAAELVDALHAIFSAFDEICDRYGLEKLKTIGDAYMFVGGLPAPTLSFAVDTVLAAMEMLSVAEQLAAKPGCCEGWQIRIGVHCGPAVAGVVGKKKFAFDIWGETVNLASRLEMAAWPNRVNLSQETYDLVKDLIECEPRGPVRTKEGQVINMYFAHQIRAAGFSEQYREMFGKEPPPIKLVSRMEARHSTAR